MGRTAIRLAVGLTVAALATAGCSQGRPSGHDNGSVDRRRLHRCMGQRGQRRRRTSTRRSSRSRAAWPPTRIRMKPPPPMSRRSPTRRWWSTTAAATTTGSTTCCPADPELDAVDAYSLRGTDRARQRTCLLRPGHRQGRRRRDRRATRRDRLQRTQTNTAPTQPNSASRPTTIADVRAGDRQGAPVGIGRRDRAGGVLPAAQRRNHRPHPAGLRRARSRRATTRPRPTSPRCST